RFLEVISAANMSLSNTPLKHDVGHIISQPPENNLTSTPEDTAFEFLPTATFTHIASMTESLDDLLAGETESPTVNETSRDDNSLAVQTSSVLIVHDELDPIIVVQFNL